jgi:hypothetical protein
LNMNRSVSCSKTKNQATWSVLVFRIIFNDLTVDDYFPQFFYTDMSYKTLVNCMSGVFKLSLYDFLENFSDHYIPIG